MNPDPSKMWKRLASFRAEERRLMEDPAAEEAPWGFAGRVVARWREMPRAEKFEFWRLWTFRSSLAALAMTAVILAREPSGQAKPQEPGPVLEAPVLRIPLP